jgi:hypothetical protein
MRSIGWVSVVLLMGACTRDTIVAFDVTEDADGDGFALVEDCNDADAAVFPGAEETCNGIDDDCNGVVDGDDASDATEWFVDLDGDGAPGTPTPLRACSAPTGASADATDCDDINAAVFPGADEVCNDRDDDCDGWVDQADSDLTSESARVFYEDADGDGHASSTSVSVESCSTPTGYVLDVDDCNDADASVFPGASELCNGVDDDCNELMDDADPNLDVTSTAVFYIDRDADGYGGAFFPVRACEQPDGTTVSADDCDDVDARIYPGATEVCDGRDNDCDGALDDADDEMDMSTATAWYVDADSDGFGDASAEAVRACAAPTMTVDNNTDCADADPAISPSAVEVCNGTDDDCDSRTDDTDPSLDAQSATRWWADRDNDGVGGTFFSIISCEQPNGMVEPSGDCEDDNADVSPAVVEVCNGIDDNCNFLVDDNDGDLDLTSGSEWFADADGDGWGSGTDSVFACVAPEGFGTDQIDCRDDDPAISPGVDEVCNGIDDNCNGAVDDADDDLRAEGASFFRDNDGDQFGTPTVFACMDFGFGWTDTLGDCDDNAADRFPGADEQCNFRDDDCDSDVDEDPVDGSPYFTDGDFDGYGAGDGVLACRGGFGLVSQDGDCDDTTNQARPGLVEICDGIDNNCDGVVDLDTPNLPEWFVDADEDDFGLDDSGVLACNTFDGRVSDDGDCDDDNAEVGPGNDEVDNDGLDNDCDGNIDIPDPLVGGLITEDITWGDGSPGSYELDFNALVDVGVTLTIEPCTRILMAPDATLQVEGTLMARGTEDCPIVFTSAAEDPMPGDWARVYFTATHGPGVVDESNEYVSGSILEFVEVLYSGGVSGAIVIEGAESPVVRDVRVARSSSDGIALGGDRLRLDNCVIEDNLGVGVSARTSRSVQVTLYDNIIRRNGGAGVDSGNGCCIHTGTQIIGNVFEANGTGLRINGHGWMVEENDFLHNTGAAILSNPVGSGDYSRNRIIGNGSGTSIGYSGSHSYSENVFADNTGLAATSRGRGPHEYQGNHFVRNGLVHAGPNEEVTLVHNTVQATNSQSAWITFSTTQASTVLSSMTGNNLYGPSDVTFLNVGFRAGSGRVDVMGNYWGGRDPNADVGVLVDFIDLASLAVADPSGFLTTPNLDAPVSPPRGVQASVDSGVVTVTWEASPESDVSSYRVHYGLERDGWRMTGDSASEGATGFTVTGTTATLSGLDLVQPWRITLTAVDTDADGVDDLYDGHESWFSIVVEPQDAQ